MSSSCSQVGQLANIDGIPFVLASQCSVSHYWSCYVNHALGCSVKIWCAELKRVLAKTEEELLFCIFQILLYICPLEKCSVPSLKDTLRHCTTLFHFALVQAVLKCALKCGKEGGVRESVFSVVTVLSLWLFTLCIKCQLNEAMSRKVNKLKTNTWFYFFLWMMVNLPVMYPVKQTK